MIAQTTPFMIVQELEFSGAEDLGEIPTVSPQRGRQIEVELAPIISLESVNVVR